MKNKEIEELLNYLKDENEYYTEEEVLVNCGELILEKEDVDLLLSYIEQLEKRNKQLYEGFMATQEELTDYATKNEQLENNRDKAIEILSGSYCTYDDVIKILKGDSDEFRNN